MPPRRIFRFAYYTSLSDDLRRRIHQLRDGDAFSELAPVLYSREYVYGGLLLNFPPYKPRHAPPLDLSFLSPSDLLVVSTRPPIDDRKMANKRTVPESGSELELDVFSALKFYFKRCARSRVTLQAHIAQRLPDAFRERADIMFHQNTDGTYMKYRPFTGGFWQKPNPPNATALYLARIPSAWENGPGLLAAFGMSGTDTLVWSYLLRTRFPEWLDSCAFVMAEVAPPPLPRHPTDLSFADGWEVTPILRLPLSAAPARAISSRN